MRVWTIENQECNGVIFAKGSCFLVCEDQSNMPPGWVRIQAGNVRYEVRLSRLSLEPPTAYALSRLSGGAV